MLSKKLSTITAIMALLIGTSTVFAQDKTLTLLTWNIPVYEEKIRGWIAEFEEQHPGFKVEWIDKKGTEWATFYQTQLAAGTPPDIIDVQGMLWVEYAAEDGLVDLTPYLEKDAEFAAGFSDGALDLWKMNGRNYLLPFYFSKTMLFLNKALMEGAGLSGAPQSLDQLLDYAAKASGPNQSGFLTTNFDWLYWPLFKVEGVKLLNDDMTEAAFNTPEALSVVTRLAEATKAGHINKISWTGRWVEPNTAFAANNVAMYLAPNSALFWAAGKGDWINHESVIPVDFPGKWAVANQHGFAISKSSPYPDEAWAFLKLALSDKWQTTFSQTFSILTLNESVDSALIEKLKDEQPLKSNVLAMARQHLDKITALWATPKDAKIKDAFWSTIQPALLGEVDPKTALDDAERKVNRVLRRR